MWSLRYLWDTPSEKVQQVAGWMSLKLRREVKSAEVDLGVVSIEMVRPRGWMRLPNSREWSALVQNASKTGWVRVDY